MNDTLEPGDKGVDGLLLQLILVISGKVETLRV